MINLKINVHNQTNYNIDFLLPYLNQTFTIIDNKLDFELIIIDDDEMVRLNNTYRKINKTTDVLSFVNDFDEEQSLGDVFINYDKAVIQAKDYEHSLVREIIFLAVHGYLHLIGYDHETKQDANEMFAKQDEILNNANIRRDVNYE